MAHWAKPGAKCVCIGGRPERPHQKAVYPEKGTIYTVRSVKPDGYGGLTEDHILLEEISNAHIEPEPFEPAFPVRFFRPLITQADDIAKFTQLLNTTDEVVDA